MSKYFILRFVDYVQEKLKILNERTRCKNVY